jgi:ubiquinone/menaquinone biosynthesis C-methylase UbiE
MHPAIQQHEELAGRWESKYQKGSFASREHLIVSSLENLALGGQKWLDAGCGTGRFSRWLAGKGCQVSGVDASPSMLAAARDAACAVGFEDNPTFQHVETVERLPFDNETFDGILCSSVIEYVEVPRRCLTELSRLLKSGGLLLLTVPNRSSLMRRSLKGVFNVSRAFGRPWPRYLEISKHEYSRKEIRGFLEQQGFEIFHISAFGGPLPFWLQGNGLVGSLWMSLSRKNGTISSEVR